MLHKGPKAPKRCWEEKKWSSPGKHKLFGYGTTNGSSENPHIQITVYGLNNFFYFLRFNLLWISMCVQISVHVYGHLCEYSRRLWKDAEPLELESQGFVSCLMWCYESNSSSLPTQQALLLLSHLSSSLFFDVYLILHLEAKMHISEIQCYFKILSLWCSSEWSSCWDMCINVEWLNQVN